MILTTVLATTAEPLMPSPLFGIWGIVVSAGVVLFIAALISVARNKTYTSGGTVIWTLIIFALPVAGPVLWFLIGRKSSNKAHVAGEPRL
ncbi:MAG: PLD nuclease N-terminal domain-containing protein [Pseudarthrobacter sp.]